MEPPTLSSSSSPPASQSSAQPTYDVVIIGAGLSGLSSAHYLHTHSVTNFVVLEARDRVGGRTCTFHLPSGHWMDLGGAYVGPSQNRILRLAHSLSIPTSPVYHQGRSVLSLHGQRRPYSGSIPSLGPFGLLDLNHALNRTDAIRLSLPHPSTPPSLIPPSLPPNLDSMTMEEWITHTCDTAEGAELYRGSIRGLLCVEPCEVSALYWFNYVKGGHGVDALIGIEGGAQEAHFEGGSQQVSERLREVIGVERVLTGKVATAIDWNAERTQTRRTEADDINAGVNAAAATLPPASEVVVTCKDGSVYRARRVIVALSPALYSTLRFLPYLPLSKQPFHRYFMGSIIKTVVRYATPWWRERRVQRGSVFSLPCPTPLPTPGSGHPAPLAPPVGYSYDDSHAPTGGTTARPSTASWALSTAAPARLYSPTARWTERTGGGGPAVRRGLRRARRGLRCLSYHELRLDCRRSSAAAATCAVPGPGVLQAGRPGLARPCRVGALQFAGTELA